MAKASVAPVILIVDDDAAFAASVAQLLEAQRYEVVLAGDGAQAIAAVKEAKPDLILMDINMPQLDGEMALLKLKGQPELRSIPIIMLTGVEDLLDGHLTATLGACEYLTKPFDPPELLAKIAAHVSQT
ncbi:MAG: response regulator [Candidatus Omnitrophica bacterium]|nr:response regulator [Candidatus Omnitrophota bacterium]